MFESIVVALHMPPFVAFLFPVRVVKWQKDDITFHMHSNHISFIVFIRWYVWIYNHTPICVYCCCARVGLCLPTHLSHLVRPSPLPCNSRPQLPLAPLCAQPRGIPNADNSTDWAREWCENEYIRICVQDDAEDETDAMSPSWNVHHCDSNEYTHLVYREVRSRYVVVQTRSLQLCTLPNGLIRAVPRGVIALSLTHSIVPLFHAPPPLSLSSPNIYLFA